MIARPDSLEQVGGQIFGLKLLRHQIGNQVVLPQRLCRLRADGRELEAAEGTQVAPGMQEPLEEGFDPIGTGEDEPLKACQVVECGIDRSPIERRADFDGRQAISHRAELGQPLDQRPGLMPWPRYQHAFAEERQLFEPGQLLPQGDNRTDKNHGRSGQARRANGQGQVGERGLHGVLIAGSGMLDRGGGSEGSLPCSISPRVILSRRDMPM